MRKSLKSIAFLLLSLATVSLNADDELDFKTVNKEPLRQPATIAELAAPFSQALATHTRGRVLLTYDTEASAYWNLKTSPVPTDVKLHAIYKLRVSFETEKTQNGYPSQVLLNVESFESKGRGITLGGINQGDQIRLSKDASGAVQVERLNGDPIEETMAATLIEFGLVPVGSSHPSQIAQAIQINPTAAGPDNLSGTLTPAFVKQTFDLQAKQAKASLNRLKGTNASGTPVTDTLLRTELTGIAIDEPGAKVEKNTLTITQSITNKSGAPEGPPLQRMTQMSGASVIHIQEGTLKEDYATTLTIKTL